MGPSSSETSSVPFHDMLQFADGIDEYDHSHPPPPHHQGGPGSQRGYSSERVLREELPPPPGQHHRADSRSAGEDDEGGSYGEDARAEQRDWAESLLSRGLRVVRVTYPRTANNEKEMTVMRGEFLEVLDDTRKWWRARNVRGHVGYVPHTIVAPFEPSSSQPSQRSGGRKGEFRYF